MLNSLKPALSTIHLTLKYPLDEGDLGVLKAYQAVPRKCNHDSLKTKKKNNCEPPLIASAHDIICADLDPTEDFYNQRIELIKSMK